MFYATAEDKDNAMNSATFLLQIFSVCFLESQNYNKHSSKKVFPIINFSINIAVGYTKGMQGQCTKSNLDCCHEK